MKIESVPKGFQDIYTGVADEAIELPENPVEQITGNSTAAVKLVDSKTVELTIRGDGDIGPSSVAVLVDGHVGEGEVPIRTEFEWDTVSKDATTVQFTKVRREPLPA